MEEIVLAEDGSIVIRLPQVVGRSMNRNTLTNFLAWKIYTQESYVLQLGSVRNLIDVDDVCYLTKMLIRLGWKEKIVSFALPSAYETKGIVKALENTLKLQSRHQEIEVDPLYYSPSHFINYVIDCGYYNIPDDYMLKLVKKYYTNFPVGFV